MTFMIPSHVRKDMLGRVRAGTAHTGDLRRAVETCFSCADQVAQARDRLRADPSLTAQQRKDALDRVVKDQLFPQLAGAVRPARKLKAHVEAERKKLRPGSNLDRATADLANDAAAVDAALYFAKREMTENGGLKDFDFDMLTTPEAVG